MISRIRFDDILWTSSDKKMKGRELHQFKKYVNWCEGLDVQLSPAILCQDIENFPEGIEYVKQGTEEGLFYPDLHGWTHGPYGDSTEKEIDDHLAQAMEWFDKKLNCIPIRWVTPHGANTNEMQYAARKYGLIIEDTTFPVIDQKEADPLLRSTRDPAILDGRVIMSHAWERGLRLYRIAQILKAGSVDEAMINSKEALDEKSYKICWNNW